MSAKTAEKTVEDKVTAARNKNLDLAIQQIAKDYGDGAIMRLGDEKIVDIDVIPTGNILIDRAWRRRISSRARGRSFRSGIFWQNYAYANRNRAGAETRRARRVH